MIRLPGAVDVADLDPRHPDAGVAAHYGDPFREQRLLATEVGLVDRSHRGVVAVVGEDRLSWLHSLTSQHLLALAPMAGTELLLLSPHGHIEDHALVFDDGVVAWLDVEPGRADPLVDFLARMVFMLSVEPKDVSAGRAVLSLVGPACDEALTRLGVAPLPAVDLPEPPPPKFVAGSVPPRSSSGYPGASLPAFDGYARRVPAGIDLLVPRDAVGDLVAASGLAPAGIWAYEALRVAARRPRFGFETDHRTLPAELGWSAAVHLEKGCYRGQETVARIHHLGRPPRRLVLLHLDGVGSEEAPDRHAPVMTPEGDTVGLVGTGTRHFELGPMALALLRRNVPAHASLRVGVEAAAVDPD